MNLMDLELSIRTINTLQNAGIEHLEDVIEGMKHDPAKTSLALAKIRYEDFVEITEAIKKKATKNLTNYTEPDKSII